MNVNGGPEHVILSQHSLSVTAVHDYKGVYRGNGAKMWQLQILQGGKSIYLHCIFHKLVLF